MGDGRDAGASPAAVGEPVEPGPAGGAVAAARSQTAVVDVVVPVHDEERGLEASIRRLHAFVGERYGLDWRITIVDNASTDGTWAVAQRLAAELDGVRALHLDEKGRGRALRAAWTASDADVVAYMDVDLSTGLEALLPLVAPLVTGHSDVSIGTRLAAGSRVVRGPRREAISRVYNLLLRTVLRSGFSDAQCGFKALRTDVARALLPLVEDEAWFFDTELLVVAERNGLRIHEVPVDWVDDPDSRVDVVATAREDLRGVLRVLRARARGGLDLPPGSGLGRAAPPSDIASQLVRFASVGVVSTVVFAVLFALLADPLGPILGATAAMLLCSFLNAAANRRLTFAARGPLGRRRQLVASWLLGLVPLASTLAVLVVLGWAGTTSLLAQVVWVTAANGVATVARFLLLRRWVYPAA